MFAFLRITFENVLIIGLELIWALIDSSITCAKYATDFYFSSCESMPSQVQATNSSHFSYRNSHEWKISQTITPLHLVLGMWYVTVLTMYLVKNKAFCKFTIRRFDKFVMPKMMLFAGVLYLCRLILTDVAIHVPYMGLQRCDLACEISTDAVVAVYTSAMLLVYTYLWIRMKVLFNTLKELQKTKSFTFQTLT